VQSGKKSGYFSMSATSSNISAAECLTRRVVRKDGMQALLKTDVRN
jgi:hypothetical protein